LIVGILKIGYCNIIGVRGECIYLNARFPHLFIVVGENDFHALPQANGTDEAKNWDFRSKGRHFDLETTPQHGELKAQSR
jgi:hypothetical protein